MSVSLFLYDITKEIKTKTKRKLVSKLRKDWICFF